jgi:hypothetical protein
MEFHANVQFVSHFDQADVATIRLQIWSQRLQRTLYSRGYVL